MRLIKFDCLTGTDLDLYRSIGIDARLSLSGDFCPDHHFAVELGEAYLEARADDVELMIIETAGLCDRCSPFLDRIAAVAVLSLTASLQGPLRMRAIVEHADLVVLTRGELVSQAEREVFRAKLALIIEWQEHSGRLARALLEMPSGPPLAEVWDECQPRLLALRGALYREKRLQAPMFEFMMAASGVYINGERDSGATSEERRKSKEELQKAFDSLIAAEDEFLKHAQRQGCLRLVTH